MKPLWYLGDSQWCFGPEVAWCWTSWEVLGESSALDSVKVDDKLGGRQWVFSSRVAWRLKDLMALIALTGIGGVVMDAREGRRVTEKDE